MTHIFSPTIHEAARSGSIILLKELVRRGRNIFETNSYGETAFFEAVKGRHLHVIKWFLKHGMDKNQLNRDGQTALFFLIGNGRVGKSWKIFRYLVERGANMDIPSSAGDTPFMMAAYHGNIFLLRFMLKHGVDKNKFNENDGFTALMMAVSCLQFHPVKFLLEEGMDLTRVATEKQNTVLHFAALYGLYNVLTILMDYGANLNARNVDGLLPIDVACDEHMRILIENEPRKRSDHGYKRYVLHESCEAAASKRPCLDYDVQSGSSSTPSSSPPESTSTEMSDEELKYYEEVNGDSGSSDEE
jgi:ankyrin repeat protein